MKRLLLGIFVLFGLVATSCGTPPTSETPATSLTLSRDQVAKAFVNAALASDETEAIRYLEDTSPKTIEEFRRLVISVIAQFDVLNTVVSAKPSIGTPTPADLANGRGEVYPYIANFAYRKKSSSQQWQNGCLWLYLTLVNGRWIVGVSSNGVQLSDFGGNQPIDCRGR